MPDAGLLTLFLVGLLGGVHCVGMCGGIVGVLSLQAKGVKIHLAYNAGRLVSYVLMGALAGGVGHAVGNLLPVQQGLYVVANLMLVAMGLYLFGVTRSLAFLERAGAWLWRRVQPATSRFLPVRGIAQAFPLGLLWGFLPCGLVYGALVNVMAAGSTQQGAVLMLAFGLGTLPNLLLAGLLLTRFRRFAQAPLMRNVSGCLVLGFGLYGLVKLYG